jgi:hypothetical protein
MELDRLGSNTATETSDVHTDGSWTAKDFNRRAVISATSRVHQGSGGISAPLSLHAYRVPFPYLQGISGTFHAMFHLD